MSPYQHSVEYIPGPSKGIEVGAHPIIMLNNTLPSSLQWQEFAHEIAHILRHSGNQYLLPYDFRVLQEWQAGHFALYFCIPGFMLQDIDLPHLKQEATLKVMEVFHVTPTFASARLDQWFNHIFFQLKKNVYSE
ncbi:ImmA/IrrE family metallo-endopeptidase [Domibacillus robiginosus]|uniref:ImmA/IrrE family metallo-endopeptidase n=1 Tax=Domibacillus robiginosus TaxID=1071054 RepID=UPI003CCBA0AB